MFNKRLRKFNFPSAKIIFHVKFIWRDFNKTYLNHIMKCNRISDNSRSFAGNNIYDITAYVQNHTLINRGITTIGGSTIPQCVMSNNKYEAQERALMGGIYFVASYLTPILLIPIYNRNFLKNKGVIDSFNKAAEKIIQVPKEYLTKNGDLKKGLQKTAEIFDKKLKNNGTSKAFEEIYNKYNNPEKLKQDLLSVHEKVLMTDFITTATMWSAIPWIATEFTEKRTKRTDFSAGFNLKSNAESEKEQSKQNKTKKLLWNLACVTLPGILYAKTVTKGLSKDAAVNKNPIIKYIANHPNKFNYTSGTNMSKLIYASIWLLSSLPAKIISARDENERKDRAVRDIGLFTMFFGGDFLINNLLGRLSDKFLDTKIMDTKGKNPNFFEKFTLGIKNFNELKHSNLPKDILKRTQKVGAGLYWVSLLTNMALIGFALPKFLNKFLRNNIKKEQSEIIKL